jgi:ketosteroid isomerase-like protein
MKTRCRAAFAISLVTLLGCTETDTTSPSVDEDIAAIADFNRRYLQSINDGDIETLSSLTTDDHIMLLPNRPPLVGKEANDDANRRVFEQFDIDETWTPAETVVAGPWAYQRGTYSVAATPKAGGQTRTTTGNFLRIYRRQPDGQWRMIRDMFNSDGTTGSSALE